MLQGLNARTQLYAVCVWESHVHCFVNVHKGYGWLLLVMGEREEEACVGAHCTCRHAGLWRGCSHQPPRPPTDSLSLHPTKHLDKQLCGGEGVGVRQRGAQQAHQRKEGGDEEGGVCRQQQQQRQQQQAQAQVEDNDHLGLGGQGGLVDSHVNAPTPHKPHTPHCSTTTAESWLRP